MVATKPGSQGGLSRVLGNRNFRLLWLGSFSSAAGYSIGAIAFQWYLYATTHSPVVIGTLAIVEFLPTLLFGLYAGALVDRFSRQRVMVGADAARTGVLALLALYVWIHGLNTLIILAGVGAVATFTAFFRPASQAILPTLLAEKDLSNANGILQAGGTTSSLVGYGIGGTLVATLGIVVALALDSASFAISAILLLALVLPPLHSVPSSRPDKDPRGSQGVLAGLRYLRENRALFLMMMAGGVGSLLFPIWDTYMVVYVMSGLHEGAQSLGIVFGVSVFSAGLGALACGRLPTQKRPGIWAGVAWGSSGIGIGALALLPPLPVVLALVAMSTFVGQLGYTAWLTGVQRTTPNHLLGRVLTTETTVSWGLFPVAQIFGAYLLLTIGIPLTYLLVGVDMAAGGFVLLASKAVWDWGTESAEGTVT